MSYKYKNYMLQTLKVKNSKNYAIRSRHLLTGIPCSLQLPRLYSRCVGNWSHLHGENMLVLQTVKHEGGKTKTKNQAKTGKQLIKVAKLC